VSGITISRNLPEASMADQKLMDYFKFDGADLQANRTGQFTEKQKARQHLPVGKSEKLLL
jgi:hypothetical protein